MRQTKVFFLEDATTGETTYSMDNYYTLDRDKATSLVNEGKAIAYSDTELDQYDRDITKAVNKFRADYDKIRNSPDPRYKDIEFFNYEASKLREVMEQEVKRLQNEYAEVVASVKDEAHRQRANLTRNISSTDKEGADQLVKELVGVAKLEGIDKAINRLENDLQYYSEGRRQAIANELYRLIDLVDQEDRPTKRRLRALSNKLREDSEGVELASRMANALPDHVGGAFTRLKNGIHPAYKRR